MLVSFSGFCSKVVRLTTNLGCSRRSDIFGKGALEKETTLGAKRGYFSYHYILRGPVVQKLVNANLGSKVNQGFCFPC